MLVTAIGQHRPRKCERRKEATSLRQISNRQREENEKRQSLENEKQKREKADKGEKGENYLKAGKTENEGNRRGRRATN